MNKFLGMVMVVCGMSVGTPAVAGSGDQSITEVSVNVKEACDISADAFDLQADGRVTGSIFEVCNTTRNYSILAVYRPLGESESISVNYNGAPRQLERSGMSVIATRFGQALRSIPVTVDATNISTPISIAFTVTSV